MIPPFFTAARSAVKLPHHSDDVVSRVDDAMQWLTNDHDPDNMCLTLKLYLWISDLYDCVY